MVNNDVYGVWKKSYKPFSIEETTKTMDELRDELVEGLAKEGLDYTDYNVDIISKQYDEGGVIPIWTLALKATKKVAV